MLRVGAERAPRARCSSRKVAPVATQAACGTGRYTSVRFTPLGSPWVDLKRLLPLLHGRRTACSRCSGGGTRGGAAGWVLGGVYRVGTRGVLPSRLIGIARAQPMPQTAVLRPPGHSRALQAPPHTLAPHTQYSPPRTQIGRDSGSNILKLVEFQSVDGKAS